MNARSSFFAFAAAGLMGFGPTTSAYSNDRDLRATTVPAASCELLGTTAVTEWLHSLGVLAIFGTPEDQGAGGFGLRFRCGLPINAIEVSNPRSNDNDISKIGVVYKDSDGLSAGNKVELSLKKVALLSTGELRNTEICKWDSNIGGSGSSGFTKATFSCTHDLAADAFYYIEVYLETHSTVTDQIQAAFAGANFP